MPRAAAVHRGAACRAWHVILAAVIAAALVTQVVVLVRSGTDVNTALGESGVGVAVRLVRLASYFTIESNLLVLALAVRLILAPARDGRLWRVLHADALLGVIVTGLVFTTVLAGQVQHHGIGAHGYAVAFRNTAVYGGLGRTSIFGNTWSWNGTAWRQNQPALSPPGRRLSASMAYDAATGNLVLFGGDNQHLKPLHDTWTLG